jgi:hypothetical protein
MLTVMEKLAVNKFAEAWNAFCSLPVEHDDDAEEVRRLVHAINAKILMRPSRREMNEIGDA